MYFVNKAPQTEGFRGPFTFRRIGYHFFYFLIRIGLCKPISRFLVSVIKDLLNNKSSVPFYRQVSQAIRPEKRLKERVFGKRFHDNIIP